MPVLDFDNLPDEMNEAEELINKMDLDEVMMAMHQLQQRRVDKPLDEHQSRIGIYLARKMRAMREMKNPQKKKEAAAAAEAAKPKSIMDFF